MPRLLLVDDNQSIHKIAESLLAPSDVELVCAKSGAEALALLDGGATFDAFLLDISMAGMDGWTLLQTLRARPDTAKTPAAMMAGVLDVVDPDRLARAPMQDYLKKPVELKDLVARVHQLLTRTVVLPEPPAEAVAVPEPVLSDPLPHEAFETVPHLKVPDALRAVPVQEEDLLLLEESDLLPEAASADLRLDDLDSLLDTPVQAAEAELPDLGEVPESPITSDLPDLGEDTQTVTAELPEEALPGEALAEQGAAAVPAEVESELEMTLDDLVASPAASLAAPPPENWADESDALVGELDLDLQATSVAIQAEDLVLDGDLTAEGLDLEDVGSEALEPEAVELPAIEVAEPAAEVMEDAEPVVVAPEGPAEGEAPEPVLEDVEPVTLADVEAALEDGTFDLPSGEPATEMQVPVVEAASPEAEAAPLSEAPLSEAPLSEAPLSEAPAFEPELEVAEAQSELPAVEEAAPVASDSHADVLAAGAVVAGAVGAVAVGAVAAGEIAPAPAPVTPAGAVDVHALLDALLADPVALDRLSRALAERLSDKALREVAWEIMPDMAERLRS